MKHKVTLEFDDEVNAITAGLRVNWVDGEDDTHTVNLSCGAGVGSPFLVFNITNKKTGESKWAVADIQPVVQALGDAMS